MKLKEIKKKVKLPSGIDFSLEGITMKVSGPKGESSRKVLEKNIEIKKEEGAVIVKSLKVNKTGKRAVGTITSLIRGMVRGASEGYEYKLKICSGHFPMNVSVNGKEVIIKNFLGEKNPRKCVVKGDVTLEMKKDEIFVRGVDKEKAGQAAADIERKTKITKRDRRVFQDGIYITEKPE